MTEEPAVTMTDSNPPRQIVRWEDPPDRKRSAGRDDWSAVAMTLRRSPQRWALVYEASGSDADAERAKSIAQSIRSANLTTFAPRGAFEAVYRRRGDSSAVYARYTGSPSK